MMCLTLGETAPMVVRCASARSVRNCPRISTSCERAPSRHRTPEQALAINAAILSRDAGDTAACNRLARAHAAVGAIKEAREVFEQVLEIDPDNRIAERRVRDLDRSETR